MLDSGSSGDSKKKGGEGSNRKVLMPITLCPNCKHKVMSILGFEERARKTWYWDGQWSVTGKGDTKTRMFWPQSYCWAQSRQPLYWITKKRLEDFSHVNRRSIYYWQGNPLLAEFQKPLLPISEPKSLEFSSQKGPNRCEDEGPMAHGKRKHKGETWGRWCTGGVDPLESHELLLSLAAS